ncbi:ATPase [Petrimonas sp. IBARAKI]|nr:ATPase [Petrimonas sp. IBARAKI]
MRANPDSILHDFETFGFLFEALCTRDMRIYAQANDGDLFHYRDKTELEADMIVKLRNGKWAAIEVKLGSKQIENAAANLLRLQKICPDWYLYRIKNPCSISGGIRQIPPTD